MYTWSSELEQCASLVNHACIMMFIVVLILCAYVGIYIWECEIEQCALLVNHACILMSIAGCVKRGVCGNIHRGY